MQDVCVFVYVYFGTVFLMKQDKPGPTETTVAAPPATEQLTFLVILLCSVR